MSATVSAAEPTPARKLILSDRVLVVAHRGNSSVAPENTLPAFQSAIDVKADLVELDYFHSADRVPVVIHDELLDRTTNAEAFFGKRSWKSVSCRWLICKSSMWAAGLLKSSPEQSCRRWRNRSI